MFVLERWECCLLPERVEKEDLAWNFSVSEFRSCTTVFAKQVRK